jgi:hypothetical protein
MQSTKLFSGFSISRLVAVFIYPCPTQSKLTRGVSHCGLAIYIKKYLNAKEELWKFKYFTMQKYTLQKNPLKETKILQDTITL